MMGFRQNYVVGTPTGSITITPYSAGRIVGGAFWIIKKRTVSIRTLIG